MLIGGEPGGGKSVALQLIVAHGALSPDCRLILIDGKRVELGLWRDCAERFIGPSIDDAIDTLRWLQGQIDERTSWPLDNKYARSPTPGLARLPGAHRRGRLLLGHRRHNIQQKEFQRLQPRHRRPRPRTRHHPRGGDSAAFSRRCPDQPAGPVRVPVGLPLQHRGVLDTILGHGWANQGYSATEIDPQARGVGWLRAEDGIPRRVKAAYLTDEEIIYLADWAAQARATHHAGDHAGDPGKVVQLLRKDDAA